MTQKQYNSSIIILWFFISALVLFVTHQVTHNKVEKLKNDKFKIATASIQNEVKLLILNKKESMVTIALSLAESHDLKQALIKKDPKLLKLKEFGVKLKDQTKYKNVWFQIVDKDGYSFYRSWTTKYGDYILNNRLDIIQMFEHPKTISSISVGKYDMTFKAMIPIYDGEQFIGVFEIITHFNSIAKELKKYNIDAVFLVDKIYKQQLTKAFTKTFINEYYVANLNAPQNILEMIKSKGVPFFLSIDQNFILDNNKLITTLNIPSISGDKMGYALLFKDINKAIDTKDINNLYKENTMFIIFLLLFISVIGYIIANRKYNSTLKYNLEQIQIQEDKSTTIMNTQPSIIIITDGKLIQEANSRFLSFFKQYSSLEHFKLFHDCICDFFEKNIDEDKYITKKEGWLEKILNNPQKTFMVAMKKDDLLHHFIVKAKSNILKNNQQIIIATFIDITEERNLLQLQERHKNALVNITKLKSSSLTDNLKDILDITLKTLNVSRVSIWLYNQDKTIIDCLMLMTNDGEVYCSEIVFKEQDHLAYFNHIKTNEYIIVNDAQNDPATKEFNDDYLKPFNIVSIIGIPIIIQGEMIGIVYADQTKKQRIWREEEIEFMSATVSKISLSLEIDKRIEIEQQLINKTKEQDILLSLFDKSDSVLFKWENNRYDIATYVSSSVVRLLGYEQKDFTSNNVSYSSCIYQEDLDAIIEDIRQNSEQMQTYFKHKPYRVLDKNGNIKWVLQYTVILRDTKNYITNYLGYIIDISEQKQKDKMLFEQSKMASLGELIFNIAHQWRQPLSLISTAASGIELEHEYGILTDEKLIKSTNSILTATQFLSNTIDSFNTFINSSREKTHFKLQSSLDDFLHLIGSSLSQNNIKVIIQSDEKLTINSYKNELMQCFVNIFNNSKDAFENNKLDQKFIFITTKQLNDKIVITFKDNAGGIPKDILPKIFEPYFTTKHQSQGTGLGLHMTYKLITDTLGGYIEAKNVEFKYNEKDYKGVEIEILLTK